MRRLAKKEPVYLAVVRTTNEDTANAENEPRNECTISVNEGKVQTPYPMQVQAILKICRCVSKRFAYKFATAK